MTEKKIETRRHEHELEIDAAPESVWKAITEARELVNWFPLQAESKPGAGGSLTYGWGAELTNLARIETWDPPRHLRTTWMEPAEPGGGAGAGRQQLAVDWFIEGKGGRTLLRLVHSGFGTDADWDEEFEGTRRGWHYELRSLKHYLERHAGRKRHAFRLRQPVSMRAPQVWERLTGRDGLIREGRIDSLGAGDRFRVVLSSGDEIGGVVRINTPPHEFAGTAENYNEGLIRWGFEHCGGVPQAHIWLSTWGVPAAEVEALEKRWKEALRQAFA